MKYRTRIELSVLLILASALIPISGSQAVTVSASGTNPAICDQTVNDTTGVTATRLIGGDCLVQFTSTSTLYSWTAPENLYSVTYLVVGGGGSGGTGWDSTGAAGGGGGMVLSGSTYITAKNTYEITVGAGGAQSTNGRTYYNGYAGENSTFGSITAFGGGKGYTSRANSGVAQAGGSAQVGSSTAPTGGSGGPGGAGGGGGGGAGGAGGAASGAGAGTAGAGVSNSITDSSVVYGAGGAGGGATGTTTTGAAGAANTGKGGGGGIGGNAASASGGTGGSGVVMIRYSTVTPTINSFALSGSPATAIFRSSTNIDINVNVASRVTFLARGERIGGCISIPTSGSGTNNAVSCPWKPTIKGSTTLTAYVKPNVPGLAGFSTTIVISVVTRAGKR